MKVKKPGLLIQIAVALALGIFAGMFCPDFCIRILNTFREIFGQFIKFIVPMIVIGLVTPAIADTGKNAGRMLLLTMALAVGSTIFSGYFSFFASKTILSAWIDSGFTGTIAAGKEFPAYFTLKIPPLADVVTSLVFSFMVGLGIVATKADKVAAVFSEFREIVSITIQKAFVPLLPLYMKMFLPSTTAITF